MRILMVCMGNICRSPLAQGALERALAEAGLAGRVLVDSAGTSSYHAGEAPDRRAQEAASRRGIDLSAQRSRPVSTADFDTFDLVLAMDEDNRRRLLERCPPGRRDRIRLLLDYARDPARREVPDPYYGGAAGFERVLDLIEEGVAGLVRDLAARLDGAGGASP